MDQDTLDYHLRMAVSDNNFARTEKALSEGAKIDNHSLWLATRSGSFSILALLAEKGADIHAKDDFAHMQAASSDDPAKIKFLRSYDRLEDLAKSYQDQTHVASSGIRALTYQSAAIAARAGFEPDGIVAFAAQCLKQSANPHFDMADLLSHLPSGAPLAFEQEIEAQNKIKSHQPLVEAMAKIGSRGYTHVNSIRDMLSEMVDCVLLPQLLVDAGITKLKEVDSDSIDALCKQLLPFAAKLMLGDKRLDQMIGLSDSWHIGVNAIPDDMRPFRAGTWQALIPDQPVSVQYKGHAMRVRALTTQEALRNESDRLDHCVGRSDYGSRCQTGEIHILSVQRDDGVSLATAEVTLTGNARQPLKVKQFKGAEDRSPPEEAQRAWDEFLQQANSGKITFNKPQKGNWGEIFDPERDALPAAIKRIGFIPSQENVDACLKHYQSHLNLKVPVITKHKRENGFASPPLIEESHRWRQFIDKTDGSQLIPKELQPEWQQMIHGLQRKTGARSTDRQYTMMQ